MAVLDRDTICVVASILCHFVLLLSPWTQGFKMYWLQACFPAKYLSIPTHPLFIGQRSPLNGYSLQSSCQTYKILTDYLPQIALHSNQGNIIRSFSHWYLYQYNVYKCFVIATGVESMNLSYKMLLDKSIQVCLLAQVGQCKVPNNISSFWCRRRRKCYMHNETK